MSAKLIMSALLAAIFVLPACFLNKNSQDNINGNIVTVHTDYGIIKIKLYDKTPQHRDNFLKLAGEGFYDSLMFHRVINEFMIQGGDPDSKNAQPGMQLGNGGPGYTIPAEFVDEYINKKGAIAAARMPDNLNPDKESSGSQFYIVQGQVFTPEELNMVEEQINSGKKMEFFREYIWKPENLALKNQIDSLQAAKNMEALNELGMKLQPVIDSLYFVDHVLYKFSPEQIKAYTTIGGAPHLDGSYTVFGEVIEGLNVVDSIARAQTDKGDRPLKDIRMYIKSSGK
ncbi:MAG: peptidylprolyl isomerase [Bacteroidota bacterium]